MDEWGFEYRDSDFVIDRRRLFTMFATLPTNNAAAEAFGRARGAPRGNKKKFVLPSEPEPHAGNQFVP